MPYFFWDPTFLLLIPAVILAIWANSRVKSTYKKYDQVVTQKRITGADVARDLLSRRGIHDVSIEEVEGKLSDHYDPRRRTLRLSSDIYRGASVAAVGIAAHEVGHAIQHNEGYAPMRIRGSLVPVANIGSTLAFPLFLFGFFFQAAGLMDLGILFYTGAVLFQVITLPVEYNASGRAMAILESGGYLVGTEPAQARKVLNAAALTYVAATAMAAVQLLRLIVLRGSQD
jgi:Zn-dependent membrane protease YugP